MDFEANSSQYLEVLRKYWIPLGLGTLGLILFVYGLISFLGNRNSTEVIPFSQEYSASESASLIAVDIEGAVIKPGVYRLSEGSIVQDVLVLSEGLSEDADRDFVAKNINLAAKLTDGAKIYIPKIGEESSSLQGVVAGSSNVASGLININSASQLQLESLPGIGPVTAGKIINNRPYSKIEDLLTRKVVTNKVFSEIKDKISIF